MSKNSLKIAYLSTWPPRPCGIATFTYDLAHAIEKIDPKISWEVIAINELGAKYKYDKKVGFIIEQEDFESYKKAAEYINNEGFDLLNLQHEFSLYGGEMGGWILKIISLIKKPLVTTLHSIPFPEIWPEKNPKKMVEILKEIASKSKKIITMSRAGRLKLNQSYEIPLEKIAVIPHGGPEIQKENIKEAKKRVNISPSKYVLSSYGLLRKNKNFEQVINALSKILSVFPETILIICGQEHPTLSVGYYNFLKELVKKLNLEKNVVFIDHYMTLEELINYLKATDIFIHTSRALSMSSSGTLTYALIAGKCILSAPFVFAKEVLIENRGILFELDNPSGLAEQVIDLLKNSQKRKLMEKAAHKFGKELIWPKVAKKYLDLFLRVK